MTLGIEEYNAMKLEMGETWHDEETPHYIFETEDGGFEPAEAATATHVEIHVDQWDDTAARDKATTSVRWNKEERVPGKGRAWQLRVLTATSSTRSLNPASFLELNDIPRRGEQYLPFEPSFPELNIIL